MAAGGDQIELAQLALLIAATEYPDLDVTEELRTLDSLAAGASRRLGQEQDPLALANSLSEYLFDEVGFCGNREDYYDPRNSFLNEVLSRRLGVPITLSLVYIEVGKRLGIPVVGVGMPGHSGTNQLWSGRCDDRPVSPGHSAIGARMRSTTARDRWSGCSLGPELPCPRK